MPFLASRIAEAGLPAIAFSFSGSGIADRAGTFTEPERFRQDTYTRDLTDLQRVVVWAERRFGAPLRFGLAGHSRGGAIALLHAAEDPRVGCIAAIAAPRAIGVWPDEYYRAWERGEDAEFLDYRSGAMLRLGPQYLGDIRALGERLDVTRAVAALSAPLLVVQGTRDALVTMDEARALATAGAANMTELCAIADAGHGFQTGDVIRRTPPQLLDMAEAVAAWMRRWLPATGSARP
jgi:dienelactone hydrolase